MRMIGQMMSMGIAMMLLALFIGQKEIAPDIFSGLISAMKTGFLIFRYFVLLGFCISCSKRKIAG